MASLNTMGGTGQKLTAATIIVAGVAALIATCLSAVSIVLQAKNYRKPHLQRYVVRILLMVPIYSIASWTSMISLKAAQFVDPIRDIYEAFTIYTFFQLLINYLDGERALIIMTHGREPVSHLWPMNHVLARVDISDPHTFLAIKRGILQYAWLKPILSVAAIIMKATNTYQEGYVGLKSGYFWSGIIYNISVTLSLYSLGLFWVCMHNDLQRFRPVPKFLCVKLIIFASYWQGFMLSILVWLGAIPDNVEGYTPDNLAAAIQDALICIEMPAFAIAHWYAFSWQDFAHQNALCARMPVRFAFRDAFGIVDLVEDTKQTFVGNRYGYRHFDSGDKIMPHEESRARLGKLKEGMRYQRGGKGKYWIPTPGQVDRQVNRDLNERDPLLEGTAGGPSEQYNYANGTFHDIDDDKLRDPEDERLYDKARDLEYGDWNYPVITAHEPLRDRYMSSSDDNNRYQPAASPGSSSSRPDASSRRSSQYDAPTQVSSRPKKGSKKAQKQPAQQRSPTTVAVDGESQKKSPSPPPAQTQNDGGASSSSQPSPPPADKPSPAADVPTSPWAEQEEDHEDSPNPHFRVGDEEEFRNVWGK